MSVYECGFVHGGMRLCEYECVFTMYMSAYVSLNICMYMVVYICVWGPAHVCMAIYRCACMFLYVHICYGLNVCVPCQIHILKS